MKKTTPPTDMTTVTIDPAKTVGPIKTMNAVNNGPSKARADQSRGNFDAYKAARIDRLIAFDEDGYLDE